jgi:hypothetical protein
MDHNTGAANELRAIALSARTFNRYGPFAVISRRETSLNARRAFKLNLAHSNRGLSREPALSQVLTLHTTWSSISIKAWLQGSKVVKGSQADVDAVAAE